MDCRTAEISSSRCVMDFFSIVFAPLLSFRKVVPAELGKGENALSFFFYLFLSPQFFQVKWTRNYRYCTNTRPHNFIMVTFFIYHT